MTGIEDLLRLPVEFWRSRPRPATTFAGCLGFGGEEFMILAPGARARDAYELAELMRKRIENQQYLQHGVLAGVTLRIGVATYPQSADHAETLIDRADQAMYAAKRSGRNQTVLYQSV